MKKKSLFIILGVLLVLIIGVIGVSFAYFTSKTTVEGNSSNTTVQTVTLEDTIVTINGEVSFNDLDIYPGHENISVLSVNATGDKLVYYHLQWIGTNTLKTPINYTIYKTESLESPTITCEKVVEGNLTIIYYETCTHNNFDNLGSIVTSGTIDSTTEETTIKLIKNEEIQASSGDGTTVYYYVILEYPNTEENQNIDLNGSLNGTVEINVLEDKEMTALERILANNTVDTSRKSGEFTDVFTDDTAGRIFEGPADDYGDTTYFFAGANPNNWVKFAGFYWRIIRVNGNGSIRLIYNGTDTSTTGTTTQISTSAFNSSYNNNMYIGYMYTSGSVHGLGTNSTIKGVLDTWYTNNLASYSDKIDTDVGFCGDRQPSTSETELNGSGGTGTTTTYYAPYIRMYSTKQFTYKCAESSDLYTVSSSSYGNKSLTNPIGLITMDEGAFAGGLNAHNTSYWLYTYSNYWMLSPSNFNGTSAREYTVSSSGYIDNVDVYNPYGVRPVLSITSNSLGLGTGTVDDPFVV